MQKIKPSICGKFVKVYGYGQTVKKGQYSYCLFNAKVMQVIKTDEHYSCSTVVCREFDLKETMLNDWTFHINQIKKIK
jgi:hypothetical protein